MSVFFFKFRQKNHPKKSPFENFDIFSFKILYLDTKLYFYTFQSLSSEREKRKLHENWEGEKKWSDSQILLTKR
jgi:hypothetical protein